MNKQLYNWYDEHERLRIFYKELLEDNEVAQITVTNCTNESREITLWGTNKSSPIANPNGGSGLTKTEATVGKRPSEVVYNPVNDLFYVINGITDTITVVDYQAVVVETIQLRDSPLKAVNPNNIIVNTNPTSTEYGFVGVTGATQREFFTIDLNFIIRRRIPLLDFPIDLVYNSVDDNYYVSVSDSESILKITTLNDVVVNYLTVAGVNTLGVNSDNGDLYVHNVVNNNVDIFNTNGAKRGWVAKTTFNQNVVSFCYNSENKKMYIAYSSLNSMIIIDGVTLTTDKQLGTGVQPIDIEYNPSEKYVYVANQIDQTFTVVNNNLEIEETVTLSRFNRSFAIRPEGGYFALNNSSNGVLVIVHKDDKIFVKVNEDYEQIREDFKYNPMLIKHMKMVASTDARINTLQIIESSISGKEFCESISLRNYQSPQSFGNVSEMFEMDGYMVDGRVRWRFSINPNQQVTFLIYYQQLEMYNFLPEKSRISTGVEMSKGIPHAWKKEN